MRLKPIRAVLTITLIMLALSPLVRADVRDTTGLFSTQAIKQADATIDQIRRQTGKDVIVEVFPSIPADLKNQYKADQKAQFFSHWMQTRARDLGVNGIYILICRDPNYLDVGVGQKTRQRAFTLDNRNKLASMMLGRFKNKQSDQGLTEGVGFIQRTMQENLARPAALPQQQQTSRSHGLAWYWWVIIAIGIIWIISRIIGAATRRRYYGGAPGQYPGRPPYGPGAPPPPGGYYPPASGGFGRGLLGGLLGGAMGGWLYDRFSRRPDMPSSFGHNPIEGGGANIPPSDQGQGFEGTGGSFDDSSGGGGGFADSGGGDFGGGDSGGGGDFGGGGDAGGGAF